MLKKKKHVKKIIFSINLISLPNLHLSLTLPTPHVPSPLFPPLPPLPTPLHMPPPVLPIASLPTIPGFLTARTLQQRTAWPVAVPANVD